MYPTSVVAQITLSTELSFKNFKPCWWQQRTDISGDQALDRLINNLDADFCSATRYCWLDTATFRNVWQDYGGKTADSAFIASHVIVSDLLWACALGATEEEVFSIVVAWQACAKTGNLNLHSSTNEHYACSDQVCERSQHTPCIYYSTQYRFIFRYYVVVLVCYAYGVTFEFDLVGRRFTSRSKFVFLGVLFIRKLLIIVTTQRQPKGEGPPR